MTNTEINPREVNHLFIDRTYHETGYFEYSAFENYAYLDQSTNKCIVYRQIGTPSNDTDTSSGNEKHFYYKRGNFMPYNLIGGTRSTNDNQYDEKGNKLAETDPRYKENLYLTQKDVNYTYTAHNGNKQNDYFFGMSMEAQFSQNLGGLHENGNPFTFEFNGDDDMWVFIDGVLMIDLGGIHDAHSAKIDFSTGIIYQNVSGTEFNSNHQTTIKQRFKDAEIFPDNTTWDDNKVNLYFNGDTLKNFSSHSMKMFYMERGAGASNLHIKFNMSPAKTGEFSVEKKLDGVNQDYVNQKYAYKAFYANGNVIKSGSNGVTAEVNGESLQFDADGTFYLRPGEKAVFKGMTNETEYYVKELNISDDIYAVEVNGETATISNSEVTTPEEKICNRTQVAFTNKYKESKVGALKITKRVNGGDETSADKRFEFYVYLEKSDGTLSPYVGDYYILKGNSYQKYVNGNYQDVSDSEKQVFHSGLYGTIGDIPKDYTVLIPGLMPGIHFRVIEREDNIPVGYEFVSKTVTADTYDEKDSGDAYTDADGKIKIAATADVIVTNRLIPKTLDINFRKTDGSGNSLADAVFQLWVDTGNGTYALTTATEGYKDIKYNAGTSGAVDESLGTIRVNQKAGDPSSGTDVQSCFKTSDFSDASADAVMTLKDIPYGKYKLVEMASPDGYIIEVKEVFFEAAETGVTSTTASDSSTSSRVHLDTTGTLALLTVDNVAGAELPSTGGPGTRSFYILGAIMVITAVLLQCAGKCYRGTGIASH